MSRRRVPVAVSQLSGAWRASQKGQIHVYRLHWSISPGAVFKYFGKFGDVESVHVPYDMKTGLSKGYGFVRMASNESARKVLDQKQHYIGDFNFLVAARRKPTPKIGSSKMDLTHTSDQMSHDLSEGVSDGIMDDSRTLSSSVDPETTPTNIQTPPTDESESSVDTPLVEDTPTKSQTSL